MAGLQDLIKGGGKGPSQMPQPPMPEPETGGAVCPACGAKLKIEAADQPAPEAAEQQAPPMEAEAGSEGKDALSAALA